MSHIGKRIADNADYHVNMARALLIHRALLDVYQCGYQCLQEIDSNH